MKRATGSTVITGHPPAPSHPVKGMDKRCHRPHDKLLPMAIGPAGGIGRTADTSHQELSALMSIHLRISAFSSKSMPQQVQLAVLRE